MDKTTLVNHPAPLKALAEAMEVTQWKQEENLIAVLYAAKLIFDPAPADLAAFEKVVKFSGLAGNASQARQYLEKQKVIPAAEGRSPAATSLLAKLPS